MGRSIATTALVVYAAFVVTVYASSGNIGDTYIAVMDGTGLPPNSTFVPPASKKVSLHCYPSSYDKCFSLCSFAKSLSLIHAIVWR